MVDTIQRSRYSARGDRVDSRVLRFPAKRDAFYDWLADAMNRTDNPVQSVEVWREDGSYIVYEVADSELSAMRRTKEVD